MKTNLSNLEKLTRGEEEIMQILWRLGSGFVSDIIAQTNEPQPKYTTVATFLKLLENKGYIAHENHGKSHKYYPLVPKEEYTHTVMTSVLSSYFDGSLTELVSFFSRSENLSMQEAEEILEILQKTKNPEEKS